MISAPTSEIQVRSIPLALQERRQWVAWDIVERAGKKTKVPKNAAKPRLQAQTNNDATWSAFQTAVSAYRQGHAGIGFVFHADDGFYGVDLDGCRDRTTGVIEPWAMTIIGQLNTYCEVSPSGDGVHLIGRGELPLNAKKKWRPVDARKICDKEPGIEIYDRGRYFCTTGWKLDGPGEPQERQSELEALLAQCPKPKRAAAKPGTVSTTTPANLADRVRKYMAKVPPAIEGQKGHDATFYAACQLVLGFNLSPSDAWPFINEWNTTCVPPWEERDLRRKLDEADKQEGERGRLLNATRNGRESSFDNIKPTSGGTDQSYLTRPLPQVQLPGNETTINDSAARFAELLGETGRFFVRGGAPMRRQDSDGNPRLETIRSAAFCSDLETVARLVGVQQTKGGDQIIPKTCSESIARVLLESAALRSGLPPIHVLSAVPVLIERDGQLVTVTGYDQASGILAAGNVEHDVPLPDAVALLSGVLADFRFPTPGDRARALAAIVTPALVFGGLLGGRAPVDLGEADQSQTGKGFRNKITCAIYRSTPRTVTQRAAGGVGSVQETFDAALVSGASFVPFDNFRGKLDFPGLESFLTEDTYFARTPYASPIAIDPRRVIIMFTSNSAEVTTDLANRCSCTRILKQPDGYQFGKFAEGDLLDHIQANQARYLGAVFAVIRAWHDRGKPTVDHGGHDFRRWAAVLGYICENILGAGGLLMGHREAQRRIASPGLTWLRDVALAVQAAGQASTWLRPHQLLEVITSAGIDAAGPDGNPLESDAAWLKATQALGRKLGKLFKNGEALNIDGMTIDRREVLDDQFRPRTEYAFFSETPNDPE